jgi:hypothetical protein
MLSSPVIKPKFFALNPKFVPTPKATSSASATKSVDDFNGRLRLRVDKDLEERKLNNLHQYFPGEQTEKGQTSFVPKFHFPAPDAEGPPLIDQTNRARTAQVTQSD